MTREEIIALVGEPVGYNYIGHFGLRAGLHPDEKALYTEDQLAAAVLAEREACAKAVEASPSYDWHKFACETAAAIRARGNHV